MAIRTMTYGVLPDQVEFIRRFAEVVDDPNGYLITIPREANEDDPEPGYHNDDSLWYEVERLTKLGTEQALNWVGDILYTLGFEWI